MLGLCFKPRRRSGKSQKKTPPLDRLQLQMQAQEQLAPATVLIIAEATRLYHSGVAVRWAVRMMTTHPGFRIGIDVYADAARLGPGRSKKRGLAGRVQLAWTCHVD
jgi:hypothetical protein